MASTVSKTPSVGAEHDFEVLGVRAAESISQRSGVKGASVALAPELWSIIIGNLNGKSQDELAFMWMTIRNVSKHFQAEVERVFKNEHVSKTRLLGDCGVFPLILHILVTILHSIRRPFQK